MRKPWILLTLATFSVAGCSPEMAPNAPKPQAAGLAAPAAPSAAERAALQVPRDWTRVERGAFDPAVASIPLGEIMARSDELSGKVVRVQAEVLANCPGGHWTLLQRGEAGAGVRVETRDPRLLFPADARGARLDVQGTLGSREVPLERARHIEEERAASMGEAPRPVDSAPREILIQPTAWVLERGGTAAAAAATKALPECPHEKEGAEPAACDHATPGAAGDLAAPAAEGGCEHAKGADCDCKRGGAEGGCEHAKGAEGGCGRDKAPAELFGEPAPCPHAAP